MYKSKYPTLIDFLTNQEDLILLDSEIQNIENLIDKDLKAINYTRCSTLLLCLDDDFNFLTKNKTYEMVSEPDGHYVVIDDFGEERLLWKKYFKILN
jgi:hypothetical protein